MSEKEKQDQPYTDTYYVNYSQVRDVRTPCRREQDCQVAGISITVGRLLCKHQSGNESLIHEIRIQLSIEQAQQLLGNLSSALAEEANQ